MSDDLDIETDEVAPVKLPVADRRNAKPGEDPLVARKGGESDELYIAKNRVALMAKEGAAADAKAAFYNALTPIMLELGKAAPSLVKKLEQAIDTRTREMFEKLKRDMQGQVNYLIAKQLYDADIISAEQLNAVGSAAYTQRQPSAPVNIPNAANHVMGNFDGVPPPVM